MWTLFFKLRPVVIHYMLRRYFYYVEKDSSYLKRIILKKIGENISE